MVYYDIEKKAYFGISKNVLEEIQRNCKKSP